MLPAACGWEIPHTVVNSERPRSQERTYEHSVTEDLAKPRLGPKLLALLFIAVLAVGTYLLWRGGVLAEISDKQRLVESLRAGGFRGPLLCIAAQFIQVVIFIIPGEITQVASGFVFGVWRGLLYSAIGILAGSGFNFYLARFVGRPTLEAFISPTTVAKIDRTFKKARTKSAMFLLFLLPGAPKDALCYAAGFSHMNVWEFLVISGLGRLPALFASTLIGSRAYHHDYISLTLTGLVLVMVVGGYYWYERQRNRREANISTPGQP